MKQLTYFRLSYCPHCRRADGYLEELKKENPEYCQISIAVVDEAEKPQVANRYDYYYVPCFFMEDRKVHEGIVTKEELRGILDKAVQE